MFISLLLCLIVGLFMLIGIIPVFKSKKSSKLIEFSIALAFSVLVILGFLEILPESVELINSKITITYSYILVFVLAIIGIIILKIIDIFIPNHSHDGNSNTKTLKHIAIITAVAVCVHNIIEGMALYSSFILSIKTGIIFSVGIALHNIALGLLIASGIYNSNNNKKQTFIYMLIISLSTFVGSIIMMLFNIYLESNFVLGIVLSLTLGMIIYISILELLPLLLNGKSKIVRIVGVITGLIVMLVTMLI